MLVILAIAIMAAGPAWFGRCLSGGWHVGLLLPFAFVFNRIFYWGFLAYLTGLGLAFFGAAYWLRRRRGLQQFVVKFAIAGALLAAHLYAFGVFGLLVAFASMRTHLIGCNLASRGIRWRLAFTVLRKVLIDLTPIVLAFAAFALISPTAGSRESYFEYGSALERVRAFALPIVSHTDATGLALAASIVVLLAYGAASRLFSLDRLAWCLIPLAALQMAMPNMLMSSYGADRRLPIAMALLLCAVVVPAASRRAGWHVPALATVFAGVLAVGSLDLGQRAGKYEARYRSVMDVGRAVPVGATLVAANVTDTPHSLPDFPLTESAGWIAASRKAFWSDLFLHPKHGAQSMAYTSPGHQMVPEVALQKLSREELATFLSRLKSQPSKVGCHGYMLVTDERGAIDEKLLAGLDVLKVNSYAAVVRTTGLPGLSCPPRTG